MKIARHVFFFSILSIVLYSCKTEKLEHTYSGPEYFPLEVGKYKIYQVDSILYDDFQQTIDTVKVDIKHLVIEKFNDSTGEEAFVVLEQKMGFGDSGWVNVKVFTMNMTSFNAQVFIDNVRFVKLTFPADKGKKWDGNLYNNNGEETYSYEAVNESRSSMFLTYDFSLTVLQKNIETLITEDKRGEYYARHIGLTGWYEIKTSKSGTKVSGYKVFSELKEYN